MSSTIADAFPLPAGVIVLDDLDPDPPAPPGVDQTLWRKRVPLAKQRLRVVGSLESGQRAARQVAMIISAELKLLDEPIEIAKAVCLDIPFVADSTPPRRVRRQIPRSVRFAYEPKSGTPILTGCPRDPRHSGNPQTESLRRLFAPFCDEQCASTCPMLKASLSPDTAHTGPYAEALRADWLWTRGGGLGGLGREVYERMAIITLGQADVAIQFSQRFGAAKLGFRYNPRSIGAVLRRLDEIELVTLKDSRYGVRVMHARDSEWLTRLVRQEPYAESFRKIARAQRETSEETDDYLGWLAGMGLPASGKPTVRNRRR